MEDENGYPVENADSRVFVRVDGSGYLAGLDNGDSTDVEEYKTVSRRLFSGKLLAVVAAGSEAGEIRVEITSMGMEPAVFTLKTEECSAAGRNWRNALENGSGDGPGRDGKIPE